jgi:hypothetical protein
MADFEDTFHEQSDKCYQGVLYESEQLKERNLVGTNELITQLDVQQSLISEDKSAIVDILKHQETVLNNVEFQRDEITGKTPRKRIVSIPKWELTKKHEDLLKSFRDGNEDAFKENLLGMGFEDVIARVDEEKPEIRTRLPRMKSLLRSAN